MSEREVITPAGVGEPVDLPEITARERAMRTLGLALLLLVATVLAYQRIWSAGFVSADDLFISGNPLLSAPDGLKFVWLNAWRAFSPLGFTITWIEHALWRMQPAPYHWFSSILHLINALILWRVLRVLDVPGAWLGAAFFALHPVAVETVGWLTPQRDLLMGLFFLLSVLAWLSFVAGRRRGQLKFYFLSLACFAVALGCDATACTLPIILLSISWLKRGSISLSRFVQVVPFALVGATVAALTWWQASFQLSEAARFPTPFGERLLLTARDFCFYLARLIWPTAFPFRYGGWNLAEPLTFDYVWIGAIVLLILLLVIGRRWIGRGAETALVLFTIFIAPTLCFVVLGTARFSFLADHYPYLASAAPIAFAAGCLTSVVATVPRLRSFLLPPIAILLLAGLAFRTWYKAGLYATNESFLAQLAADYPLKWLAYYDVANVQLRKGNIDESIMRYKQAIDAYPRNTALRVELGNDLVRLGRTSEAVEQFRSVLAIDPGSAAANNQLAIALLFDGKLDEAREHAEKSVAANPNDAAAQTNLGIILSQLGEYDAAVAHFQKALEVDPRNAQAHFNYGNSLRHQSDMTGAIAQYRSAIEFAPDYVAARMNLANALLESDSADDAISELENVLAQHPDFAPAHASLAAALNRAGRWSEAADHARAAARLQAQAGSR